VDDLLRAKAIRGTSFTSEFTTDDLIRLRKEHPEDTQLVDLVNRELEIRIMETIRGVKVHWRNHE